MKSNYCPQKNCDLKYIYDFTYLEIYKNNIK